VDLPGPERAPPELAERFEILGSLGQGAMGAVWRARERGSGRELALKTVSGELSPALRARFEREGELTARLRHPGIVRIHSAGELGGMPFLAYELIEGCRTYRELLEGGEQRRLLELLRDAARAVGHAHRQGVVHRDLKADNLLVDGEGRLRVADFGLATAGDLERLTQSGALLGTPLHMAPEQFVDGSAVGPPADVWALGVLLHRVLAGEYPFSGPRLVELMARVTHGRPRPLPASTPAALRAIQEKALARDPARRYPDAGALAEDLERALRGEPLRPATGRGAVVVAAGLCVLALAGAGALGTAWLRPDEATTPAAREERPRIELREPAEGALTLDSQLTLRGVVHHSSPVELAVGPERVSVRPGEEFTLRVPLPPGETTLELTARDARGGESARLRRRVVRIEAPPWFQRLDPAGRPPLPLPPGVSFRRARGEYLNEADGSVLLWIPPGKFVMGADDPGHPEEQPAHEVVLTRGYFLGKFEVTQEQFLTFLAGRRGEERHPLLKVDPDLRGDHPARYVSWEDARSYCDWARLRMPTEAEWEYAARGPRSLLFPGGNVPGPMSNRTEPVGSHPEGASPFGVHDMSGGVYEWVADVFAPYRPGPQRDPRGPGGGERRIRRGGSDGSSLHDHKASHRDPRAPDFRAPACGMRVARSSQ
jgi:formylglycine-generating enzyme required for sulfatase activity